MEVRRVETLATRPAQTYHGTFAASAPEPVVGAELPPGWEGLYFPFDAPLADLRPDGSPARDGVLPEIDLPRRLYAGEDTVYRRPLRYGQEVEQVTRVGTVNEKAGRQGRLVFADLVREYRVDGAVAIESTWHDVFLEVAPAGVPARRPELAPTPDRKPDWTEELALDSRQLFRFSALTFNTHRIHYDRDWARAVEGLDDLLVHGPLTRLLLLDAAIRHEPVAGSEPSVRPRSYSFVAHAPVLVTTPVTVHGRRVNDDETEVLAVDLEGGLLARGHITW